MDRSRTAGIYGISFIIQSAEHSPPYLQAKICEFIDTFYNTKFTKENFEKFKAGVLSYKKGGFSGIDEEAEDLYSRMRHFAIDPSNSIEWNRADKEIECIENYCTYEKCKEFYRKLFSPQETASTRKVTPEDFQLYKKVSEES